MFDWNAALGLIGVVIGGLITFTSERSFRNRHVKEERRAVALAFAAEIDGWLEIMKRRNHAERLSKIAERMENGEDIKFPPVRGPNHLCCLSLLF